MAAYYNEIDPYAAQWLRNLMKKNLIPAGDVDERSIIAVSPDDLIGYTQCHFFAGLGGWAYAARLAGWPDDQPLWTGSPPCQPFSVAGKGAGQADERHLWPEFFRLIDAIRPSVLFGEQVAAAIGKAWLDGVFADLESAGYACGAAVLPACAVNAPHRRDRLWFFADAANANGPRVARLVERPDTSFPGQRHWRGKENLLANGPYVGGDNWPKPLIRKVDDGVSARVGRLRAYGNAIVPQVAAEVIGAYLDARP